MLAENRRELLCEPLGQYLEVPSGNVGRVDGDTALGAPERHVHERRLPCHQLRQRADLVQGHTRVVAEAPLERTAGMVVLHAISRKGAQALFRAGADVERDFHGGFTKRVHQELPLGGRQPEAVERLAHEDGLAILAAALEALLGNRHAALPCRSVSDVRRREP